MSDRVLINGQPADHIPVSDRGLQYGDGLFETLAVIDSRPRLWERHMARLSRGEGVLGLPISDKRQLRQEADRLCTGCERGVLKLIITRGSGGRGYRPPEQAAPRRILSLHDWPDYPQSWYRQGMRLRLCETRWGHNPQLAGIKHLNRLEQVMARQEWRDPGIAEGIMLDLEDRVISATQGNLFLVDDNGLHTPDLSRAGISGVIRDLVIESAGDLDMTVGIDEITLERVQQADALFVTNSILGLCPVAALEGWAYAPERVPESLRQTLEERMRELP
ncbi:MAG: aminodeoxychorismate lyase [Candidatus Thiodiazotropha sp.]